MNFFITEEEKKTMDGNQSKWQNSERAQFLLWDESMVYIVRTGNRHLVVLIETEIVAMNTNSTHRGKGKLMPLNMGNWDDKGSIMVAR